MRTYENIPAILILLPFYFKYEDVIKTALKKRGYNVFLVNENIHETSLFYNYLYYFLHRIVEVTEALKFGKVSSLTQALIQSLDNNYFNKKLIYLEKKVKNGFDYVIIIKGDTVSTLFLKKLKSMCHTKLIMYQWDCATRVKNIFNLAENCNLKFTFDRIDAINYNWEYRPLFFDTAYKKAVINKKIDISFICSLHSHRKLILEKIEDYVFQNSMRFFKHIFVGRYIYFVRQKYISKNPSFQIDTKKVKFKKLSLSETNKIYDQSFAILDYKFPEQNGLTMRSIEALGHRCKLITNNRNIVNEPFYNPNNIYIYDYEDVEKNGFNIPLEFFSTPYEDVPEDILYRYTIDGWIDDILGKSERAFER